MFKKLTVKFLTVGFILTAAILIAVPAKAGENINNFFVTATINQDASVDIEEAVEYDFGEDVKHGIIRKIPVRYDRNGGVRSIRISDIKVVNGQGEEWQFTHKNVNRNLEIKIGDPDVEISGVQVYKVSYRVEKAINYFDEHDEFYWNATGNAWPLPITQAKLTVVFPNGAEEADLRTECFAGPFGSTNQCLSTRYDFAGKGLVSGAVFISDKLNAQEGMTAVIGLPKKMLREPSIFENIIEVLRDNLGLLLPILAFGYLFYRWRQRGRDPEGRGTIVAQYDVPDGMTPIEAGTMVDERADNRDISADIINLAVRGYIKINRVEEKKLIGKSVDYLLEKKKEKDGQLKHFENKLFDSLFEDGKKEVKMSDLKEKFYKDLAEIKKLAYQAVTEKGYFAKNPSKVRMAYYGIGLAIAIAGFALIMPLNRIAGYLGIGVIISGVMTAIFGYFMPSRTVKGKEVTEHLLGLKLYLSVAEKDRLDFHNAPEKKPEVFEKLLPFAMVFGVEGNWAKQFEGIYRGQPEWYNDPNGANFTPVIFASSLSSFAKSADSTLSSAPSSAGSGGSGFSGGGSGGGFGGGGGGSW